MWYVDDFLILQYNNSIFYYIPIINWYVDNNYYHGLNCKIATYRK